MPDHHDAKSMAKTLRADVLALTRVDLTHGQCLEIVAHQFGAKDWNVLAAKLETPSPPGWRTSFAAATTIPGLR